MRLVSIISRKEQASLEKYIKKIGNFSVEILLKLKLISAICVKDWKVTVCWTSGNNLDSNKASRRPEYVWEYKNIQ